MNYSIHYNYNYNHDYNCSIIWSGPYRTKYFLEKVSEATGEMINWRINKKIGNNKNDGDWNIGELWYCGGFVLKVVYLSHTKHVKLPSNTGYNIGPVWWEPLLAEIVNRCWELQSWIRQIQGKGIINPTGIACFYPRVEFDENLSKLLTRNC